MKEGDLQNTVIDMCQRLGLMVAHFRPAQIRPGKWATPVQGDGAGFPDLVVLGRGGVLFRELKADGRYPEADQRVWLAALRDAGADVDVWRPKDLRDGCIERQLKDLRKPPGPGVFVRPPAEGPVSLLGSPS